MVSYFIGMLLGMNEYVYIYIYNIKIAGGLYNFNIGCFFGHNMKIIVLLYHLEL